MGADEGVRDELRLALRNGPFAAALHLAIEVRRLTLEEIQVWLAERGARLSVATLSYWRRGRSRPERADSLRAVRLLEDLLELPTDALVSLLGPRRPRGRWLGHTPGTMNLAVLFGDARPLDLLAGVGMSRPEALSRVITHVTISVDGDRLVTSVHMSELVRANVPRVSRCAVMYIADEQPDKPPALTNVRYCRVGRTQVDPELGLVAAELVLDRVLDAGDVALLDYEWRFSPGARMVHYEFLFREPVREYVLQVGFASGAVPARCERYDRRTATAPQGNRRELWIGGSNTALLAESDVPAGIIGMRWDWPPVWASV